MQTYEIGFSAQQQFNSNRAGVGKPKKHIVEKVDDEWTVLCTGSPASRQYKGYIGQVNCGDCKRAVRQEAS